MLISITKKIYPTSGGARQLFDKLGRSINADHNAAAMFQIVEFAIEAVAIHAILNSLVQLFQASGGASSAWIGWGITAFVWTLSIAAAMTIQVQYASNLYMMEQVNFDKTLAAKLGAGAATYTRNARILFALCLVLNAWGGYILLDKVIFKADQTQIVQVEKAFAEAKKGANERYSAALEEAKKYDAQIAQSRQIWTKHAASKPDEKTYAANKMKAETTGLLKKKTDIIEAATADRKAELEQETAAYAKQKTALVGAVQSDLDKQSMQEWLSLAGSLFFSFMLLVLVGALHRRATKNELLCGVKYVLQMPSNEEQSALNSFLFLAKFVVNGIGQTIAVAGFFVAQKLLKTRLNLSGYNDTAATENILKQTKIELAQAQIEAEQQAREAAKNRVENVPFEVEQDEIEQPYPDQNDAVKGGIVPPPAQTKQPQTTANKPETVANSVSANSVTSNSANSTTANNSFANSANNKPPRQTEADRWREEQRLKKLAGETPKEEAEASPTNEVQLDAVSSKIAETRAALVGTNKSQTTIDFNGKKLTIRDLETMLNTYSKRAVAPETSAAARENNRAMADKISTILILHSQQQQQNDQH